jgi:surface protein
MALLPNDIQNIVDEYIPDCCIDGTFLDSCEISDYLKESENNGRHIVVYKTLILSDIKLPNFISIKYEYNGKVILKGNVNHMLSFSKFNGDISRWDVSNVTDMSYMFYESQFNRDISGWDVSNVTNMNDMFNGSKFNRDISKWNVSGVKDTSDMFSGSKFNCDISGWNVSNVTYMYNMFAYSEFNGDVSGWNVSNVTDMSGMFCI